MSSTPAEQQADRRCAVVYNPVKVSKQFRSTAERVLAAHGWQVPLWLETTVADPGRGMVREAVQAGVALVIGAGGDGTVRICADGLAHTGIPLGVVPAGTANLLARNLGIPLAEKPALEVACRGAVRTIDLIKITVDGGSSEHFAVMAGAGVDAVIMDETDPDLKRKIGSAAYFVAAGKALGRLPMKAKVQLDDHRPQRRNAMLVVVGNVGQLQAAITLIPQARPDDGLLDVFIASPNNLRDWLTVLARLITRRRRKDNPVEIRTATRVRLQVAEPDDYQLDGDVAGTFSELVMEVQPMALAIMVPGRSGLAGQAGPPRVR